LGLNSLAAFEQEIARSVTGLRPGDARHEDAISGAINISDAINESDSSSGFRFAKTYSAGLL
jgi:hypothetical protein